MKWLILTLFLPVFALGQINWQLLNPPGIDIVVESQGFVIDSSFYLVGGGNISTDPVTSVWEYKIAQDVWVKKHNIPDTVWEGGGLTIHNTGYILDGSKFYGGENTAIWQYNVTNDSWDTLPGYFNYGAQLGCSFAANGRLFTCFGLGALWQWYKTMYEYDFATGSWLQHSDKPGAAIFEAAVGVVDSFAYFCGGRWFQSGYHWTNGFWRYNVNQDKWDSLAPIPGLPRTGVIMYTFKNFIIAGFGDYTADTFGGIADSVLTDLYKFDFHDSAWLPVTYTGTDTAQVGGNYFQYGTKCYYCGGWQNHAVAFNQNLYMFDAAALGAVVDTQPTGIGELPPGPKAIGLCPNPNSGSFVLSSSGCIGMEYCIFDLLGQAVQQGRISTARQEIWLDAAADGIYSMKVDDRLPRFVLKR